MTRPLIVTTGFLPAPVSVRKLLSYADHVAVPLPAESLKWFRQFEDKWPSRVEDFAAAVDGGFVIDAAGIDSEEPQFARARAALFEARDEQFRAVDAVESLTGEDSDAAAEELGRATINAAIAEARWHALVLRSDECDAVSLFSTASELTSGCFSPDASARATVLSVVLKNLPTPSSLTEFSRLHDFYRDERTTVAMRRMRVWMQDMARVSMSGSEVEDRLLSAVDDYRQALRAYRIQEAAMASETIFVTALDVVEDVVKGRWSSALQRMLGVSTKEAVLLKEELELKGREVALMVQAEEAHGAER